MKGATEVNTSNIETKPELVSLKTEVDKIDVDKIRTVAADFSKLSNVVDNEVAK